MKLRSRSARRIGVLMFSLCAFGLMTSASMPADGKFAVEPVVEKKVKEPPAGPLYWRLENFPTLTQAQGAAGPTSLAAEVAGKVWLFTLGPKDGVTPRGTKVVEIGRNGPESSHSQGPRTTRKWRSCSLDRNLASSDNARAAMGLTSEGRRRQGRAA